MQFDNYHGHTVNLLDTPGHEDFSEDTYRVLTAVDAAVMVIDAAKGVQAQTIKLLNVCRMRDTPIITFVNKLTDDGVKSRLVTRKVQSARRKWTRFPPLQEFDPGDSFGLGPANRHAGNSTGSFINSK